MIILELSDGLGNQLFQYAVARCIQEKTNKKLYFNVGAFDSDKQRNYSLGHFRLTKEINYLKECQQRRYVKLSRIVSSLALRMKLMHGEKAFYKIAKRGFFSTLDIYNYYGNYSCSANKIYVKGSFQSPKYFEEIKELLLEELQITEPIMDKNVEILNQIRNSNSVCVHVRRGDYVSNAKDAQILNICTESYYQQAMRKVAERVDKPVFWIFSNSHEDIEWIKENYKWEHEVRYVDQDNCDYEELRLMLNCKHFILSNSTFSWWAQYLAENKDKVVLAPSKWYNGTAQDASDIYMEDWEIINV